ncbi:hypothetical protein [Mucilaginibacter sp. L196]|uniref:hypothetical protein n=1 Tax=Mucilaginibacter sp. L196 TaxID=1641870 RepID=UPI00131AA145|nr:hypothetical protein [Mucilaginibacter sp. L196]
MTNDTMTNIKKKYILKPGKHQFAPGSAAIHHNDNLSDTEAEWYLEKYPHIVMLFESSHSITHTKNLDMLQEKTESNDNQIQTDYPAELLTPPSGGREEQ